MEMKLSTAAGRLGLPWWGIAASCAAGAMAAVVIWQTWGIPFFHPQPETLGVMIRDGKPLAQLIGEGVKSPRRNLIAGIPEESLRPTANSQVLNLTPGVRMQINGHGAEFTPERARERVKVDK
jgi:hypothetical protein